MKCLVNLETRFILSSVPLYLFDQACNLTSLHFFTLGKQAIEALPVKCDNVEKNCKWVGTVATLKEHLTKCPFSMVPCPNMCGCSRYNHKPNLFLRKDLNEHMQTKCPYKAFECKRCGHKSKAMYPDLDAYSYEGAKKIHDENCVKKRVTCPNLGCSKTMQRQNIKRHFESCGYTMLPCKYAKLGCDTKLKKQEITKHEEDDKLHLSIALDSVVKMQDKMEKLESDVKKALCTIETMEESFEDRVEEKIEELGGCSCHCSF